MSDFATASGSAALPLAMEPPDEAAWEMVWARAGTEAERADEQLWRGAQRPLRWWGSGAVVDVLRVNQVDAARLDAELVGMLREQLLRCFEWAQPGLVSSYDAELAALLELLVWRFSIWEDRPTPGNALMNLRYRDERRAPAWGRGGARTGLEGPPLTRVQKVAYVLAVIGGKYAWSRLNSVSVFQRWGDRQRGTWMQQGWLALLWAEHLYRGLSLLNLLAFLFTGVYRTPIERLLRARLIYAQPTMSRQVSFEYMNRQLVWHEFSELMLLLLPLLNFSTLRNTLLAPFSTSASSTTTSPAADACAVCNTNPITVPYAAEPCEHRFCYYCLRARCGAQPGYRCPACQLAVQAMRRIQPKVNHTAAVDPSMAAGEIGSAPR